MKKGPGSVYDKWNISVVISTLNCYCVPELIAHRLPKCVPYTNQPESLCTFNRNYSAILATLQITSHALGV
jgi:hypothetical protein